LARGLRGVLIIKRDEILPAEAFFPLVEAARLQQGMSVSELCRRAEISRRTYYNFKLRWMGIMPETLEALQKVLCIQIDMPQQYLIES
jgi:transcriptional regulator with XRE-family HTH domain